MKKLPKISNIEEDESKFVIFFDCGDLGKRKKVENFGDFVDCNNIFYKRFYEYCDYYGVGYEQLEDLAFSMNYSIPDASQFNEFCKNGKYDKNYPYDFNLHYYFPLIYRFKYKTLDVDPFFIALGDQDLISVYVDFLKSVKVINIWSGAILEGELADQFEEDKKLNTPIEKYLQNYLHHEGFVYPHLTLKQNDIRNLKELRKSLKSDVKIAFPDASKEEKNILKKAKLI